MLLTFYNIVHKDKQEQTRTKWKIVVKWLFHNTTTDSGRFYDSVLEFLDNPDEKDDVKELLDWWNG